MLHESSPKKNEKKLKDLCLHDFDNIGDDGEHGRDNREPWEVLPDAGFHLFRACHSKGSRAVPARLFSTLISSAQGEHGALALRGLNDI